ncbi:MAG: hypothetical protein R3230_00030 [Nitrosopumilaceae archaeon]|nr:hypothetical protein [Nitrosopumilaceae archaeon]
MSTIVAIGIKSFKSVFTYTDKQEIFLEGERTHIYKALMPYTFQVGEIEYTYKNPSPLAPLMKKKNQFITKKEYVYRLSITGKFGHNETWYFLRNGNPVLDTVDLDKQTPDSISSYQEIEAVKQIMNMGEFI